MVWYLLNFVPFIEQRTIDAAIFGGVVFHRAFPECVILGRAIRARRVFTRTPTFGVSELHTVEALHQGDVFFDVHPLVVNVDTSFGDHIVKYIWRSHQYSVV